MDLPDDSPLELSADSSIVPRMRATARRWALDAGLDPERAGDVALAVTEAATNAVLHAFVDREPGTVTLRFEPEDGRAVFCLSDDGRGLTPRADSPGLGMGLSIMGRLADHIDVASAGEGGTVVRMAFNAPALITGRALHDRLEAAYGPLADAVTVNAGDSRLVYANPAAVELLDAGSAEELVRRPPEETTALFHITLPDGRPVAFEDLPHVRALKGETDTPPLLTRTVHRPSGRARWLLTSAVPLDGDEHRGELAVNFIRDVTEATEAERRARFLADVSERLALAAVDLERTFTEIAQLAVPGLADWCAVDVLGSDGLLDRVALAHPDPDKAAIGRSMHERWPPDPTRDEGVYAVVRTGEPLFVEGLTDALLEQVEDVEHREALRALGMRSVLLTPMTARGRVVGVLTLVTADSGRTFDQDAIAFAAQVAARAGVAVDNAERIEAT